MDFLLLLLHIKYHFFLYFNLKNYWQLYPEFALEQCSIKVYFPDLNHFLARCEVDLNYPDIKARQFNWPTEKISNNFHDNDNDHN